VLRCIELFVFDPIPIFVHLTLPAVEVPQGIDMRFPPLTLFQLLLVKRCVIRVIVHYGHIPLAFK
jgi:hypothetical protein